MANNIVPNELKNQFMQGLVDFDDDDFYVALTTSACDAVADNTKRSWVTFSGDIQALGYEVTGTNYTSGGVQLSGTGIVSAGTPTGFQQHLSADNVVWSGVTLTSYGCVVYRSTDSLIVCYLSYGSEKTAENGSFTLAWNSTYGIVALT
jgi:hypothetical protein